MANYAPLRHISKENSSMMQFSHLESSFIPTLLSLSNIYLQTMINSIQVYQSYKKLPFLSLKESVKNFKDFSRFYIARDISLNVSFINQ